MRHARPLGLTPDGLLLLATDDGDQIAVTADERLRAALRGDLPRLGQLEIDMNSTLTPREIQARIRSGETLDEVARAAGVPVEKVEPFAAPIIAEREHVAGMALSNPVRRTNDTNHRQLRTVVNERLLQRGIDPDTVGWDSLREADRTWVVVATYQSGSATRRAEFAYDQMGRFSIARNDDAKWLTGEQTPSHGPQPGKKRPPSDPDHEPTVDFSDEFAIVRAVGAEAAETPADAADSPVAQVVEEVDEEWVDVQLTEVDGVYDIVPGRGELDNLYDMFAAFSEDSVEIYPGLGEVHPVGGLADVARPQAPEPVEEPVAEPTPADVEGTPDAPGAAAPDEDAVELAESTGGEAPATQAPERLSRRQRRRRNVQGDGGKPASAAAADAVAAQLAAEAEQAKAQLQEPEQLSLVDHAAELEADEAARDLPVEEQPVVIDDAAIELSEVVATSAANGAEDQPIEVEAVEHRSVEAPAVEHRPGEGERDVEQSATLVAGAEEEMGDPEELAESSDLTAVDDAPEAGNVEQPALPEPEPEDTTVLRKRPPAKKRRAQVPSWDEIMFGGPKK